MYSFFYKKINENKIYLIISKNKIISQYMIMYKKVNKWCIFSYKKIIYRVV